MSSYTILTSQLPQHEWSKFLHGTLRDCLPGALPVYCVCRSELARSVAGNGHGDGGELWVGVSIAASPTSTTTTSTAVAASESNREEFSLDQLDSLGTNPWIAAYIDLRNPGQTQVWLYASWERDSESEQQFDVESQKDYEYDTNNSISTSTIPPPPTPPSTSTATATAIADPRRKDLFESLFSHLRTNHVPRLPADPPASWLSLRDSGKIVSTPYSRSKVLFGSVHERHLGYFRPRVSNTNTDSSSSNTSTNTLKTPPTTRPPSLYNKYIIAATPLQLHARLDALIPPDLRLDTLHPIHHPIVLARSPIPRSLATLAQMRNVAVLDADDTPVSWGFVGRDGSIASLWTEEAWRRRGLAAVVARRLMQVVSKKDEGNDVVYFHADVGMDNVGSGRVMEAVGGRVWWRVAWVEVELGM